MDLTGLKFTEVEELPSGYTLFKAVSPGGGIIYATDECGFGLAYFDSTVMDIPTMRRILEIAEQEIR